MEKDYYDARFRFRSAFPHEEDGLDDRHDISHAALEKREAAQRNAQQKADAKAAVVAARLLVTNQAILDREANANARKANTAAKALAEKATKAAEKATKDAEKVAKAAEVAARVGGGAGRGGAGRGRGVLGVLAAVPLPVVPPVIVPFVPLDIPAIVPVLPLVDPVIVAYQPPMQIEPDFPVVAVSRSGRTIRPPNLSGETMCECGCGKAYDKTTIVICHGGTRDVNNTGCAKRLHWGCGSTYLCRSCELAAL